MYTWIFVVSCVAAFGVSFGIGANDLANSFGTAYGSKVLTIRQIVVIAAVCEFSGALLLGAEVSKTIAGSITSAGAFTEHPAILMYGMFCALISTAIWLVLATLKQIPVSTTHSIIGSVVGFALVFRGPGGVMWASKADEFPFVKGFVPVAISWVTSPVLALLAAMAVFWLLRRFVLRQTTANASRRTAVSFVVITFFTVWLNMFFIFAKGMKDRIKWSVGQSTWVSLLIATGAAVVVALASPKLMQRAKAAVAAEAEAAAAAATDVAEDIAEQQRRRRSDAAGPLPTLPDIPVVRSEDANPRVKARDDEHESTPMVGREMEPIAPSFASITVGGSDTDPSQLSSPTMRVLRRGGGKSGNVSGGTDAEPGAFSSSPLGEGPYVPQQRVGGTLNASFNSMRVMNAGSYKKSVQINLPSTPTAFAKQVVAVYNESFGHAAETYPPDTAQERFNPEAEYIFKYLQIFSAIILSFSHGANDVSNSIGALASIYYIFENEKTPESVGVEIWMLVIGGLGICVGLATFGQRILVVLGEQMVVLTPSRGFTAQFAASLSVSFASAIGLPISTTHSIVGAVVGVGLIERAPIGWNAVVRTAIACVLTVIVTCVFCGLLFAQGVYSPSSDNIFS